MPYNCVHRKGFLPRETAQHHRQVILEILRSALAEAGVTPKEIDVVCYTKGPGMAPPLLTVAIVARTIGKNLNVLAINSRPVEGLEQFTYLASIQSITSFDQNIFNQLVENLLLHWLQHIYRIPSEAPIRFFFFSANMESSVTRRKSLYWSY